MLKNRRLDTWLENEIAHEDEINLYRNRLIITVQARRLDAEDQLRNLWKRKVNVLLVAGHSAYDNVDNVIINDKMKKTAFNI